MKTINLTNTQLNTIYRNMYNRCYNERVHELQPNYIGCTICEEWLSLPDHNTSQAGRQAFYDWVNDGNFYEIEGEPTVQLDHDILVKGNRIYSPDTCVFVPASVNAMFGGFHGRDTEFPVGVEPTPNGKFRTSLRSIRDVFDTPEEAWRVYAEHQKAKVVAVADFYGEKIPRKLYEAMIAWQFEIND